jgi:hypothetical protein
MATGAILLLKNQNLVSFIIMTALLFILGAAVFVTHKFRVCMEKEEGDFKVLHR